MKTLIVNKDGSMEIKDIPKPEYGPKQALVKTIACGMCGTDVKLIHQTFKGFPLTSYPLMLGHEGVGEVIEVGSEVKGLKVGDKVLLPFVDPNPKLYGDLGAGYGALCEYGVVNDVAAYPAGEAPPLAYAQSVIPNDIDPVDAVMFVTFREVLSAVKYFRVKPADSIVVFGCGPVGLTFIKVMNLMGVKDIVAVDIVDEKLKEAAANGAKTTINATKADLTKEVRAKYPDGVHHVLDAVGLPLVANQAFTILRDRGNILCYGVLEKEQISFDFSPASYNWNFICQQMPEKPEEGEAHEQILDWVRGGKLVMKEFISDYFEFKDSVEAYEKLLDRKILKKAIIKF